MIRIFDVIWNFLLSAITRYSAGKSWSSISIQNILKAELLYQINLIRLLNIITGFLYRICLTDKSDENNYLYV